MAEITIGTYNVRNMFDAYTEDGSPEEKPTRSMQALGEMVEACDADLLAVQEVENIHILREFNQDYLNQPYAEEWLFEGNSERGIDVGLLSRFPVKLARSHRHLKLRGASGEVLRDRIGNPYRIRRDLLRATVKINADTPLTVFVVHLKSKGPLDPDEHTLTHDEMRLAEARAIAEVIGRFLEFNPRAYVALMGDFNDDNDGEEGPLAPLTQELGLVDPLADKLADPADRWTYSSRRWGKSRLDYLLISEALAEHYIEDSVWVHRQAPSWRASDHRPLTARFRFD